MSTKSYGNNQILDIMFDIISGFIARDATQKC